MWLIKLVPIAPEVLVRTAWREKHSLTSQYGGDHASLMNTAVKELGFCCFE